MIKRWCSLLMFVSLISLGGCTVTGGEYSPISDEDYIYTVGYYGYQPGWAFDDYSGYRAGGDRWRGYDTFYGNRGWHGFRR